MSKSGLYRQVLATVWINRMLCTEYI